MADLTLPDYMSRIVNVGIQQGGVDGDIVEQGTHEELLVQGGFYAELYNSQFENGAVVQAA